MFGVGGGVVADEDVGDEAVDHGEQGAGFAVGVEVEVDYAAVLAAA